MAPTLPDLIVSRKDVIYAFSAGQKPVLEVRPGTVVVFETQDCFGGQIQSESDRLTDIDMEKANPASGPVGVVGAEPGDSLVAEILEIRPAARGFTTIFPGVGQLANLCDGPRTKVVRIEDGFGLWNNRIRMSLRPMVGVIGVAPETGEVATLYPGEHGGNLDDQFHCAGTRVYLPVRASGALFAVGDMHASMGDAEVCGTGIEVAGEVTVRFQLLKGVQPRYPLSVTHDSWIAHGVGETYADALQQACSEAARVLTSHAGMSIEDAFMLLSVCGDAGVCQSCQPCEVPSTARMTIPRLDGVEIPFI